MTKHILEQFITIPQPMNKEVIAYGPTSLTESIEQSDPDWFSNEVYDLAYANQHCIINLEDADDAFLL